MIVLQIRSENGRVCKIEAHGHTGGVGNVCAAVSSVMAVHDARRGKFSSSGETFDDCADVLWDLAQQYPEQIKITENVAA